MMVSVCWLLRTLRKSLNVLSYAALSSLLHCPSTFRLLVLPEFSICSFQVFHRALPECFLPQGSKLGQSQDLPHLFSISQGSLSLLAWCSVSWKPLFHILFGCPLFGCFRQEGKCVSVTPFWWEADVWSGEWKFSSLRYELGEDQFESINFMAQQSERELTMFQYNYVSNWRLGELKRLSRCGPCTKQLLQLLHPGNQMVAWVALSLSSDIAFGKTSWKGPFFACRVHEN